jgi:hypothetical protein
LPIRIAGIELVFVFVEIVFAVEVLLRRVQRNRISDALQSLGSSCWQAGVIVGSDRGTIEDDAKQDRGREVGARW